MKTPNEDALGQIVELACGVIDFDPKNRKEHDKEALQSLADSIKAEGLLQPIVVRGHPEKPARYMLIAGERRLRAHLLNKAETIAARVARHDPNAVNAAGAARKRLVENLQREDLTPIEEARGYRELAVDFRMTHAAIAALAGVSQPVVGNALRLLDLPGSVQELVQSGALTRAHGVALARFKAWPKICEFISAKAIKEGSPAKDLEQGLPFSWALKNAGLVEEISTNQWASNRYTLSEALRKDPDFLKESSEHWCCLNPAKWAPEKKRQDEAREKAAAASKSKEAKAEAKNGKPSAEQLARKKKIASNKANRAASTQALIDVKAHLKAQKKIEKNPLALIVEKLFGNGHYGSKVKDAAIALGIITPKGLISSSWHTAVNAEKLRTMKEHDIVRLAAGAIALYHGEQAVKFASGIPEEIETLIGKKGGKTK